MATREETKTADEIGQLIDHGILLVKAAFFGETPKVRGVGKDAQHAEQYKDKVGHAVFAFAVIIILGTHGQLFLFANPQIEEETKVFLARLHGGDRHVLHLGGGVVAVGQQPRLARAQTHLDVGNEFLLTVEHDCPDGGEKLLASEVFLLLAFLSDQSATDHF
jgi:hypothetical protein